MLTDELPAGCTGFWRPRDGDEPPQIRFSREDLARLCNEVVRRTGWRLMGVDVGVAHSSKNFHQALLVHRTAGELQILANPYVPCLAAAAVHKDEGGTPMPEFEYSFRDLPRELASRISSIPVLSAEEACRPVTRDVLKNLGRAELEQLSYWQPKRVGDILFNLWD